MLGVQGAVAALESFQFVGQVVQATVDRGKLAFEVVDFRIGHVVVDGVGMPERMGGDGGVGKVEPIQCDRHGLAVGGKPDRGLTAAIQRILHPLGQTIRQPGAVGRLGGQPEVQAVPVADEPGGVVSAVAGLVVLGLAVVVALDVVTGLDKPDAGRPGQVLGEGVFTPGQVDPRERGRQFGVVGAVVDRS